MRVLFYRFNPLIICLLLLLSPSLSVQAAPLTAGAGPYKVTIAFEPDPPVMGSNTVRITAVDSAGKPAKGLKIELSLNMLDMSMTPYTATATPVSGSDGVYEAPVTLSMEGRWALTATIDGHKVEGELRTGAGFTQGGGFNLRGLLWWLLLPAAAAALLLLVKILRRRGTSGKNITMIVVSLAVLFIIWFVTATAVKHFRRPGQMDIIEAQAMDMTVMKAPVGVAPVAMEEVKAAPFEASSRYSGSVVPYSEMDVYPRVTGWIVDMPVYPGDRVVAGQLLARLDSNELRFRAREARFGSRAAVDGADAARADEIQAMASYDGARAALNQARSAEMQMQAEVEKARKELEESQNMQASASFQTKGEKLQAFSSVAMLEGALRQARSAETQMESGVRKAQADLEEAQSMAHSAREAVVEAGQELVSAEESLKKMGLRRGIAESSRKNMQYSLEASGEKVAQARAEEEAALQGVRTAQAQLESAQANLEYWKKEIAREAKLLKEGGISQEEYDREYAQSEAARAEAEKASAALTQARQSLAKAKAMVREAEASRGGAESQLDASEKEIGSSEAEVRQAEADVQRRKAALKSAEAQERAAVSRIEQKRAEVASAKEALVQAREAVKIAEANLDSGRGFVEKAHGVQAQEKAAVSKVDQKRADLASAKERLIQAREEVRKAKASLDAAGAMREAASARRRSAFSMAEKERSAAGAASTVEGYTEVRAQGTGVVTQRVTSPGVLVQPGTLILKVAQVDRVRLQAAVSQEDAKSLRRGSPVYVRSVKNPKKAVKTELTSVFPASDPVSRTAVVEAVVSNSYGFLPGEYITMDVVLHARKQALSVPASAVVESGGQNYVWLAVSDSKKGAGEIYTCPMHPEVTSKKPGSCPKCAMNLVPRERGGALRALRVPVKVGLASTDRVEIVEGVQEGDLVIYDGHRYLNDGDKVREMEKMEEAPQIPSGQSVPALPSPTATSVPAHGP